jgi:hypothetical protein
MAGHRRTGHPGIGIDADGLTVVPAGEGGPVSVPPLLVVGPGGAPVVGWEAERLAAAGVGVAYRDMTSRVGDPVPVVGSDGSARSGAALTASAVAALLRMVAADAQPGHTVLAHPAAWREYDVAEMRAALDRSGRDLGRVSLVTRPIAGVTAAIADRAVRPGATVVVADIGRHGTDLALVTAVDDGAGQVVATGRIEDFGSGVLDHALVRHVLERIDAAPADRLQRDPAARGDLRALVAACRTARQDLARLPFTVVDVRLAGYSERVRIVRAEFEAVIREPVQRAVTAFVPNLGQRETSTEWDGVVILGDAASTPLLVECISTELGTAAIVGGEAEWAVARGAARIAAARVPRAVPAPGRSARPTEQAGPSPIRPVPPRRVPQAVAAVRPAAGLLHGPAHRSRSAAVVERAPLRASAGTRGPVAGMPERRPGRGSGIRTAVVGVVAAAVMLVGGVAIVDHAAAGGRSSFHSMAPARSVTSGTASTTVWNSTPPNASRGSVTSVGQAMNGWAGIVV